MVVPPTPDPEVTSSNSHDRTQSATFRKALLGALVVVMLATAGALVWLLADRRGDAEDRQAAREEVMAQTEQFMLRMGTFGPDLLDEQGGMPEYRERVKDVITPKFGTSFDEQAATAEQLVSQAGVSRVADVFATGVSQIDDDSATALVAGSFTDAYPQGRKGEVTESEPVPFRIEATLVLSEGTWLVDNFTPVTGAEE